MLAKIMEKEYGEAFPHHTFEQGLALETVSIYYYLFQSCCAGDKTQSLANATATEVHP